MQDEIALERKTKEELKQIAQGLEIDKISALKKDELIEKIREKLLEQIKNVTWENEWGEVRLYNMIKDCGDWCKRCAKR